MGAQRIKSSKFVLGAAELQVLGMLNKAMTADEIVSHLLTKEIVTSRSSGEKVVETLEQKKFLERHRDEVNLTKAGSLLQDALKLIGTIKTEPRAQKKEAKGDEKNVMQE